MRGRKIIASTILCLLVILFFAAPLFSSVAAQEKPVIAFTLGHGEGDFLLAELVDNLTAMGFECKFINDTIDASDLEGVDILILGSIWGEENTYSDSEINAIKAWFEEGKKAIWVAGDSDYGGGNYIIENANKILEAIGAHIRVEPTSVEDPESNCAAAYRVAANVTNKEDKVVAEIVEGVEKPVLFHGPSILYGLKDGNPVALEEETIKNVYWVMKTSAAGVINDHDDIMPKAHENGQEGSFVVMAVELYAGPKSNNKIVVSSAAPYGDYRPMFIDEYKDVLLDGPILVKNTIEWMAKVEAPTPWTLYIVVGVAVIVVVVAVVVVMTKRK